MYIKVLKSGEYISENMLKFIFLDCDTPYEVVRSTTNDLFHMIRTERGIACVAAAESVQYDPNTQPPPRTGTETRRFMYVIVRTDMELQNIIVQSAHAAYESGLAYKNHADRTSIIVLQVKSELYLRDVYNMLQRKNIQCTMYKEHSLGLGYTAIGTEALTQEQRSVLKKYKLLKVK